MPDQLQPKPKTDRVTLSVRVSPAVAKKVREYPHGAVNAEIDWALRKHWRMPRETVKRTPDDTQ